MRKKCSRCREVKLAKFFNKKKRNKDGLSAYCKECNKQYHREHYQLNRDDYLTKSKTRRRELAEWLVDLKEGMACEKCEEDHPGCLDFHHRDPTKKDLDVSQMVHEGFSRESILKEIEKCHVWCSNCHRKHHYNEIKEFAPLD